MISCQMLDVFACFFTGDIGIAGGLQVMEQAQLGEKNCELSCGERQQRQQGTYRSEITPGTYL